MLPPLTILIVEDQPVDVDLMLRALLKAGYETTYECVETEACFLEALRKPVDLILADYTLPQFNGLRALELLQEQNLDIPFILISGTIDEEVAVQAIKKGAADYILKDRLARLGPAVEQTLSARRLQQENNRVAEALQESETKFRLLVQQSFDGIVLSNGEGEVVEWNASLEKISGIARIDAIGRPLWEVQAQVQLPELKKEQDHSPIREAYLRAIDQQTAPWFYQPNVREIQHMDGSRKYIESVTFPVKANHQFMLGSVIRDVTTRVLAEQESRRQAERAEALVRLAGQLNAQLNLETVSNVVCRESAQALNLPLSIVMLYEPVNDHLVQVATYNRTEKTIFPTPPIPLPIFESYVPPNHSVTVIDDLHQNTEWELSRLQNQLEARTAVYLRMSHAGRFVGVLAVFACGEARNFREDELALLSGFANQASVAIYNAWLFEQVHKGRQNFQALSRRLVEIQEDERRSIARELHDEIGQALTGLKMLFDTLPELPVQASERLQMGRALVVDLIERTRRISLDLRPSMLDDLGLLPALLWHIKRCQEQSLLEIDFKHAGVNRRFSPAVETAAYRIIQEGCTNIIRHAGVNRARIRVWVEPDTLHIKVEDQGIGFDSRSRSHVGSGGGLSGMRERAVLVGGSLTIRSYPSKGTTLIARLPLKEHVERRIDAR